MLRIQGKSAAEVEDHVTGLVESLGAYFVALMEHTLIDPAQQRVNEAKRNLVRGIIDGTRY